MRERTCSWNFHSRGRSIRSLFPYSPRLKSGKESEPEVSCGAGPPKGVGTAIRWCKLMHSVAKGYACAEVWKKTGGGEISCRSLVTFGLRFVPKFSRQ